MHFISFHLKKTNERAIESINEATAGMPLNHPISFQSPNWIEMDWFRWPFIPPSLSFNFTLHSISTRWMGVKWRKRVAPLLRRSIQLSFTECNEIELRLQPVSLTLISFGPLRFPSLFILRFHQFREIEWNALNVSLRLAFCLQHSCFVTLTLAVHIAYSSFNSFVNFE